jgi:hypothetical protein
VLGIDGKRRTAGGCDSADVALKKEIDVKRILNMKNI